MNEGKLFDAFKTALRIYYLVEPAMDPPEFPKKRGVRREYEYTSRLTDIPAWAEATLLSEFDGC